MKQELEIALALARQTSLEELPRLLGDLEEIRATALSRLTAPMSSPRPLDELLDVKEAARRLGVSVDYLYRAEHPFTRHIGRRRLFSALGIEKYIRQQSR